VVAAADLTYGFEFVEHIRKDPDLKTILKAWEDNFISFLPPDPNWDRMERAEKAGCYAIWVARKGRRLVGFIEWHLGPTFHQKSTMYAIDGGHFVTPEHCGTFDWLRMWRLAMEALRELGVQVVIAHDSPARPLNVVFTRLGFAYSGQQFVRAL
jgi:hypothetical protein